MVLSDAFAAVSMENFIEMRKAIDKVIVGRITVIYYCCLALSLVVVFLSIKEKNSLLVVTSVIALVCLIVDTVIAVKGNVPINNLINALPETEVLKAVDLRAQWLTFIHYRGILATLGMISLLTGLVFAKKV
jgi:hypothetical protein